MRLAIVGPGRMGHAVRDVAAARGHDVTAVIGRGGLASPPDADVAIEFTTPEAAADNLVRLAGHGIPTVCGTTGWYDRLDEVAAAVDAAGSALLYAPNFSLGVQLLLRTARELAARATGRDEFDGWIEETHHRHKRDAPSGTAAALRDLLRAADASRDWPVVSIRGGEVPGTHVVRLDATGEAVSLTHTARDRSIFARGAVIGAEWLIAQPRRGVHEFGTALFGEDA